MDVSLSDSEEMVRETARKLAAHLACKSVAEFDSFDTTRAWKSLQETGFVGLRLPADVGGGDGTTLELSLVVQALAYSAVPVPYLGQALAAELLAAAPASPELLERVASGELRCTLGLTPDLRSVASAGADEAVAFDASEAQALVLFDANRTRLHIVAATEPVRGTDLTRAICRVDSAPHMAIGDLGGEISRDALDRFHARALTLISADLLGVMEAALESAVSYAAERLQFGVPIGSFQAVQQLASDQLVSLEGARSLTEYAAWAVDESDVDTALIAALSAKAYCSSASRTLCEAVIQIHGGTGITWDCMAHVYLRRALLDAVLLGDYNKQILDLTTARRRRAA